MFILVNKFAEAARRIDSEFIRISVYVRIIQMSFSQFSYFRKNIDVKLRVEHPYHLDKV